MANIQDVFKEFYPMFLKSYCPSSIQAKAANNILNCKTAAFGANSSVCSECGHTAIHYNSCRNRHCPMCQGINKLVWIDQRNKDVVNAPYFHAVFTLPKILHSIVRHNQELLYNLMYKVVAQTLSELTQDNRYLGAQIGFMSVLHTWSQTLHYHPHIHSIILAGGLTKDGKWVQSSKSFFLPVKVISKVYRGKFLFYLKRYYKQNLLKFYGSTLCYNDPIAFQGLIDECYSLEWYCYKERTFNGPLAVMKYLGNYTHRIAISNYRIVAISNKNVCFKVKDRKSNLLKTMSLPGVEFIRRFLLHILPKGFVKIRYFGLLANRNKKSKLVLCLKLTSTPLYSPIYEGLGIKDILSILLGIDVSLCSVCNKGTLKVAT